jgi:hypothetical protein
MLLRRRPRATPTDAGLPNHVLPTTQTNQKEYAMTDSLVSIQSRTESRSAGSAARDLRDRPRPHLRDLPGPAPDRRSRPGTLRDGVRGVTVDENVLDSHVEVVIDAASITTHIPHAGRRPAFVELPRCGQLPEPHLLGAPASRSCPRGSGRSPAISPSRGHRGHRAARRVRWSRPDPFGNLRVGFHATTTISRRDFGLVHQLEDHSGSLHVARDVTIEIDAEAVHPL